jgi:hypothetical protein
MSPDDALNRLADQLREDEVIAPLVREPTEPPVLGRLAAAGPRAADAADQYTLLFEAIREGYLLHYGTPRLLDGADPDLRLLAGDYLYAVGLERLAALGDLDAVRELGDLISLSAELAARSPNGSEVADALWLASAVAVAAGPSAEHDAAKAALRDGAPEAAEMLQRSSREAAGAAGMEDSLDQAADSIGFATQDPDRG